MKLIISYLFMWITYLKVILKKPIIDEKEKTHVIIFYILQTWQNKNSNWHLNNYEILNLYFTFCPK